MTANLFITPSTGTFDVERLRKWFDVRPDVFEVRDSIYCIEDSPADADFRYACMLRKKSSARTGVHIEPLRILVENDGGAPSVRSALDFVLWLQTQYQLRFGTGWSGEFDVTEVLRAKGVEHHYDERDRLADRPWERQLREIGFFSDRSYADWTTVTTAEARRDTPVPDEDALVAYLETGHVYRAQDTLATDNRGDIIGPVTFLTDGVYLWPSLLAADVRREHVRLPRHFVIHARANRWRVPQVDLAALPGSPHFSSLTVDEVGWYSRFVITPSIEGDACSLLVAKGLATTCKLLRSGGADAVYRGRMASGAPVLVTFTMRHPDSYSEMQYRYRYEHDRVAPLLFLDRSEAGRGFIDEMVEAEPPGRSLLECGPLPEAAAIRLGIEVARVIEIFEDQGVTLGGLSPEVIYVDDSFRFTQLTPRSRTFVANALTQSGLPTSYPVPYSGHESLVLGINTNCDVFALCASLFQAVTGKHPFGASLSEILQRITTNQPLPYPGSPAFGELLARGLGPKPSERPSATELAQMLSRLT